VFLGIVSSIDGLLLLILIIPWTLLIYTVLCFRGIRFSANDHLEQLAGRLYWVSQGAFQSTVIAVLNIIIGVIIIPDYSLIQFEEIFFFSSTFIFLVLPLPSFLILNTKKTDQERLYELIFQEMAEQGIDPPFIEITSELLTMKERYTEEYSNRLNEVRNYVYQFLNQNFPQLAPFFQQDQNHRLNLENLAIFLTRRVVSLENEF
jgi:hypothetical protein